MGSLRSAVRVLAIVALVAGSASAQFLPSVQISSGAGCANPAVERDLSNNLSFAYECGGDIYFASSVFTPGVDVNVTNGSLAASKPDIFPGFAGQVRIAFQRESAQPSAFGDDIFTVTNTGGPWGSPITLVLSDEADADVDLAASSVGDFAFAWWRTTAGADEEVFLRRGLGNPNELLGPGARPSLAYDFAGDIHVVFERAGSLIHVSHDNIALSGETTLAVGDRVAVDAADDVHVAFMDGGSLRYLDNEGGSFGASELIDTGVSGTPAIAVGAAGAVAITYEKNGQILVAERTGGTFAPPTVVAATTTGITPDVALDTNGYLHVVFDEGGAIFYTNNVPLPTPDFVADVTEGEIFLEVNFTDTSTGVYNEILWDFGDGATSELANPTHIYEAVGSYTVSLTTTGPGGTATETKTSYITANPPTSVMTIPHISAFASESIRHPVIATIAEPIQGFQLAIRYDNGITPIDEINFDGTVTGTASPEFVAPDFIVDGADSYLILGVVLEVQKPIEGETIPPGPNQLLATLDYTIPIGLSLGTSSDLTFENGLSVPPINNVFSGADGFSVLPFLNSGSVTIDSLPMDTFLRGDATNDISINIADAIYILSFLFTGGPEPVCPDAADANDTGAIDVADTITVLNYLFVDGPAPSYPFPAPGLDPTPDSLGACMP